jgi:predicted transcriptional regulator
MDQVQDKRQWNYTKVDNAVIDDSDLTIYDKMTYIALCRFADHNTKDCFPGHQKLAEIIGASKPMVIKSLKRLEDMKLIEIQRRTEGKQKLTNIYNILGVVNTVNQGSKQGLLGVVNDVNQGSKQRLHKHKPYNINQMNINKSSKDFADDSPPMTLAKKLQTHILSNNPKAKTGNLQKWALEFDRMMRLDSRSYDEIVQVIEFSQRNSFWMSNILSAKKLREQFDRLYLQSQRQAPKEQKRYTHQREVSELSSVIQRKTMVGL